MRDAWCELPAGLSRRDVATAYAQCAAEWGDRELPRFGALTLTRLEELGRRIADAAQPALGSVFAGWRALPPPDTPAARVGLTMHVLRELRELRGAAHVVAVLACGLTPLHAVLASPAAARRTGAPWAEHLGWVGPFEEPAALADRRRQAEDLTDTTLVPVFGTLEPSELAEFAELCTSVRDAIAM